MKAVVIVAIALGAIVALVAWSRQHPIETFVALTRRQLARAGMAKRNVDGVVYWTGGRGDKTVVLLHGVNDQAGSWAPVVRPLAASHRLIIPDLAGHGESEPRTGPLSLDTIVEKLHAVIEKETAGKVTLVGNSMGGWVAMLYTFAHPDRVEALILEDASGMAWPLPNVPLVPKTREDALLVIKAVHGPNAKFPDSMVDAMLRLKDTPMSRMLASGVRMEDLVDMRLPSISVPVTIVWGKDDGLLPVAYAETLQKRIAGSRLCVIDGAAHIPHRQQPEKFLECLKATY